MAQEDLAPVAPSWRTTEARGRNGGLLPDFGILTSIRHLTNKPEVCINIIKVRQIDGFEGTATD